MFFCPSSGISRPGVYKGNIRAVKAQCVRCGTCLEETLIWNYILKEPRRHILNSNIRLVAAGFAGIATATFR